MIVVSDTSVITSLLQIGEAELLQRQHQRVLIPAAVRAELTATHPVIPGFLEVHAIKNHQAVERLQAELDRGEAEAIILAKEIGADLLLIDEKLGREIALREGLNITGLVGLLLESKQLGHLRSIRDVLHRLETEAGFRLAPAVKTRAIQLAGE
jgi:predicted nucleic acid-binding protein